MFGVCSCGVGSLRRLSWRSERDGLEGWVRGMNTSSEEKEEEELCCEWC